MLHLAAREISTEPPCPHLYNLIFQRKRVITQSYNIEMSDRPSKRSRRGGERPLQDGPDRRNRPAEAGRDRDRRDRRGDDDAREHRRYRSRSRDRQDRNRDSDRPGDKDQVRMPGRDQDRKKDRKRDRGDKHRDGEVKPEKGEPPL